VNRRAFCGLGAVGFVSSKLLGQYEESRGETPWVPTPDDVIQTMLRMARVTRRDRVYDLGCGDGRILITAARQFGCRGVGIDIEPERIRESREGARAARVDRLLRFEEGDFHSTSVREATVVMVYLFTRVMAKLKPKLLAELRPGTRVVAYQFNGFGDWTPAQVDKRHDYPVYLWTVPPATRKSPSA
jgi:SAM-dependent methyltransferase